MVHAALSQLVLIRTIGDVEWGIRESYYTVTMRQVESTHLHRQPVTHQRVLSGLKHDSLL